MVAWLLAYVTVQEPVWCGVCTRCDGGMYAWPVMLLLPTGVQPGGAIVICPDCDPIPEAVSAHVAWLRESLEPGR